MAKGCGAQRRTRVCVEHEARFRANKRYLQLQRCWTLITASFPIRQQILYSLIARLQRRDRNGADTAGSEAARQGRGRMAQSACDVRYLHFFDTDSCMRVWATWQGSASACHQQVPTRGQDAPSMLNVCADSPRLALMSNSFTADASATSPERATAWPTPRSRRAALRLIFAKLVP